MKYLKIILILISLSLISIFDIFSQSISNVKRVNTRSNSGFVGIHPPESCERIKVNAYSTLDKTRYDIYIKEYVNNKYIHCDFELIQFLLLDKGRKNNWELVVDTTNIQHVKISYHFHTSTALREKFSKKGNRFSYKKVKQIDNSGYDKEYPLLIVYDEDAVNKEVEASIKQYVDVNNEISIDKVNNVMSKINRCIIVYYIKTTY